jgi:hypothetical protein
MRMCDSNYIHPGFIFIPCLSMTPGGLRAQYLIPNLMPKCECLSIHLSLPFEPRHHAIPRNQRKQSLCRTETNCRPQAPLPNLLEKILPRWAGFVAKSGPQISPSLVPIFGVNKPLYLYHGLRLRNRVRRLPSESDTRSLVCWSVQIRDGISFRLSTLFGQPEDA